MKVLIIANGSLEHPKRVKKLINDIDYVICADGGVKHLEKLSIWPNLIVGDFDSVDKSLLDYYVASKVEIQTFPADKDKTDTHLAIDIAIGLGAIHIVLVGAIGTRFDHSYANLMLLYYLQKKGIESTIIDAFNQIRVSNSVIEIRAEIGQTVSILPFGDNSIVEEAYGFKYPLKDKKLFLDNPLGISNVLIAEKGKIVVKKGWILVDLAND